MFKLTLLNLSSFNTENVLRMEYMFSNCTTLSSLNLSSFNIRKAFTTRFMFLGCSGLIS